MEANKTTVGKANLPAFQETAPSPAARSFQWLWGLENRCCRAETAINIFDAVDNANEEHSARQCPTNSPVYASHAGMHGFTSIFSNKKWESPVSQSFTDLSDFILQRDNDWIFSSFRFIFLAMLILFVKIITGAWLLWPTSTKFLQTV
jgi:hypothetical protein